MSMCNVQIQQSYHANVYQTTWENHKPKGGSAQPSDGSANVCIVAVLQNTFSNSRALAVFLYLHATITTSLNIGRKGSNTVKGIF